MSQPAASQPAPAPEPAAAPEPATQDVDSAAPEDATAEAAEQPLNRAARRAKAKVTDPSHVGPRGSNVRQGRGPRSNSKRPR